MTPPIRFAARRAHGSRDRATAYRSLAAVAFSGCLGLFGATAAGAVSGGAGVSPAPVVTDVRCVSGPGSACVDRLWAEPGARVELRGRGLGLATKVLFYGSKGKTDDAYAPAQAGRRGRVTATVPDGATSGPVAVVTRAGVRSRRWSSLVVDDPAVTPALPQQTGTGPAIGTRVAERKVFYGGIRKAVFSYRVAASWPVDVQIKLVRLADGAVVGTWEQPQVAPATVRRVTWNGRSGGRAQPDGLYSFQALVALAGTAQAGGQPATGEGAFSLLGHIFPIRGVHDFGGAGGHFGAGRGGRSHQGQDVFARCGTPLVAARAGKVVFKGYHQLAGYYVVVRGSGTRRDYVYAHLRAPSLVNMGDRVFTGQQLGEVGDSGNARGCHLHLELWSAPGWYRGGRPFDPLPELLRWDQSS